MSEPTYIAGLSSQPSFTEPPHARTSSHHAPHARTSSHHAPHAPNHTPWMDLSAQISSLGTRMEELAVVSDTRFYSMEDCMDQYQTASISQFQYLQQRFQSIEDHIDQ